MFSNMTVSPEQRFSQTSTAVATPCRPLSPSATIVGTDDNPADFSYEVFQTRDSLEIARTSLAHQAEHRQAGHRRRRREASFPLGRNSLELARRNIARAQPERQRRVDDATAHAFLQTIGSKFWEDRAALTADPVWDYQLTHRDSLELPREKVLIAAHHNARRPAQRLLAKARALPGALKAAFSGLSCKCLHGEAGRSSLASESKVGLLD